MKLLLSSLKSTTKKTVVPHRHERYEWHFIIAGSAVIYLNGKDYPIRAGDFFLIRPGETHGIAIRNKKQWLVQITFETKENKVEDRYLIEQWLKSCKKNPAVAIGTSWHGVFVKINQDFRSKNNFLKMATELQFESILYQILGGETKKQSNQLHPQVEKTLKMMESNITKPLELEMIAQQVGLDKSYLIRLFKSQLRQTPMQYFMCLKMEWSATRLIQTDVSIAEIAYNCGFADPFHFSRRFKHWSGLSPNNYRKQKNDTWNKNFRIL